MKLTYAVLLNAKPQDKPYKIRDRDSMYLRVSVSGSKIWKFDYRLDGKDCSYTLGRFPALSISDARRRRNDAAKLVESGIHPKAHELQLQLQAITHNKNTFWSVCEDWIEDNRGGWSESYCGQAIRFLSRYVKDSPIGKMPVRDIKVAHVYDLLQSIAKRKTLSGDERKAAGAPHIAVRLRLHLDAIFRRATIKGITLYKSHESSALRAWIMNAASMVRCMPIQMVLAPGSPSLLRPRKPPSEAIRRTI